MGSDRKVRKAVCLLSGGMDSAVCLGIARAGGYEVYPLTFAYGQRHRKEIVSAKKLAKHYETKPLKTFRIDLRQIGGSALTDDSEVPPAGGGGIPATYVPARNTIFLSIALAYAEKVGADRIFIGVNSLDYSGYPDCRPEYLEKFQGLANVATKKAVEGRKTLIEAPLLRMTKAEIVREGERRNVPFELTWSCYSGGKKACGKCDSCVIRLRGFSEAGLSDPLEYER